MAKFSSLVEQLIERLQSKERLDLEFKECKHALSHDLWETVSAFANTQGGWLLLGVNDKGMPVGINNPDNRLKELFDMGRNRQKISAEIWSENDISIEPLNGSYVIVIRISAVPRTKKPIYINGNPMTGTFIRRHESDYRCNEDEVRRMFRDASTEATDSGILPEFSMDSFKKESILKYRQRLQNRTPEHEYNDYPEKRFLTAIRAMDSKGKHPTVAGILMFGTEISLHQWRHRHFIDYRSNAEKISDTLWIDRISCEGNLFETYFKIFPKLTDNIPIPHEIKGGERIEETPTHIALREAFVNFLVHADYAETDASLVVKSPEGFLFRNPGSSRVSSQDLYTGNRSDPRNPNLLFMFRLIGLAEEAGSGLPKIIRAWRELGLQLPDVEIGTERYEFTLLLKNVHLISEDDRKWLKNMGGDFNEEQQLALLYAKHKGMIDNERLRTLIPLHPTDATKTLTGLRNRGFLEKISDKRGAFYQIYYKKDPGLSLFDNMNKEAHENLKEAPENLKEAPENLKEAPELLKEIADCLKEKMPRKLKRKMIENYIYQLCSIQPFGANELSQIFNMSHTNMVVQYINKLTTSGKLEWTGKNKRDKTGKYKIVK